MGLSVLEHQYEWQEVENGRLLYIETLFDHDSAEAVFNELQSALNWRQDNIRLFGKVHPIPRLQAWYGDASYRYSNLELEAQTWYPKLAELKALCEQYAQHRFNTVLANLYRDGQDSNGWHSDNEPELGTNPLIASLSFGGERRFLLKHKSTGEKLEFNLASGSLLIMAGETQHYWQHTIPKTKRPVAPRINLTFRKVLVP